MEAAGPGGKGVDSAAMTRVFAKYLLFQVPGWIGAVAVLWALVRWWNLDPRLAVLLFGAERPDDFDVIANLEILERLLEREGRG